MAASERKDARARRLAGPRDMALPFTRAREFYTRTADDGNDPAVDGLPVARPTIAVARQVFHDEIVLLGFRMLLPANDQQAIERINREVIAALECYGQQGWMDRPEDYFAAPPTLTDVSVRPVTIRRRAYERVTFDSGYEPRPGEPGRERWLGYAANRQESALVLRHREPRPWVVCVHGALMGRGAVDLRLFRARHLHDDLGLNVVLPVLPLHGRRTERGAVFPGQDVLDNVHAAAQAVWDIRRILSWIRAQEPDSPIGLNSMSLGGYVTALVASLEEGLTCAILGVPVADLISVLGRHAGLRPDDPRQQTLALAEPLGRMISPLSLRPRVPMQGRFIYAGVADRVVHPRDEVAHLWEHWGRPEIEWYEGGHTGFFRSRRVHDFIDGALLRSGLIRMSHAR